MYIFTIVSSIISILILFLKNIRKILKNESIPNLYIDAYSKIVLFELFVNPPHTKTRDIKLPLPAKPIKTISCMLNLKCPAEDEDMKYLLKWQINLQKINNMTFSNIDFTTFWKNQEEATYIIDRYFKEYLPPTRVDFSDMTSDDATSRFIFQGMGFDHIEVITIEELLYLKNKYGLPSVSNIKYKVCYDFMNNFSVLKGLECHGANAYFNGHKYPELLYIERKSMLYDNNSEEWEYLKFVLRSAAMNYGTIFHHAAFTHFSVSNACNIASRETLSKDIPLRRLLHIFTVGSAQINLAASVLLIPKYNGGFARKGLGDKGTEDIIKYGLNNHVWRSFPEQINYMELENSTLPIVVQGMRVWNVIFKFCILFVKNCVNLADIQIYHFWNKLEEYTLLNNKKMELNENNFIIYLSKFIFTVTAYHSHIGQAVEYFHPFFYSWALKKDTPCAPKMMTGLDYWTILGTGASSPMLLDNWDHIFAGMDSSCLVLFHNLQDELRYISETYEPGTKWEFQNFNPKYFLSSVSI